MVLSRPLAGWCDPPRAYGKVWLPRPAACEARAPNDVGRCASRRFTAARVVVRAASDPTCMTPHDSALGGPDGIGISSVGIKSMPSAVAPAERFSARAAAGAKTTVEIAKAKGRQRRR